MTFQEAVKKYIPQPIRLKFRYVFNSDYRNIVDRRHSFGNLNKDKVFYVFRSDIKNCGIYSIVFDEIIMRLQWALKRGYVPVFDFQNYRPPMMEDQKSLNLWYRYFQKADDYVDLSEVYQSRNVIIGRINSTRLHEDVNTLNGFSKVNQPNIRAIFNKYMQPTEEVLKRADEIQNRFSVTPNDKVLGIVVRECYRYVNQIPEMFHSHPKVLSFEEQRKKADECMRKWGCDYVFLIVDDREYLEKCKKYFGDRLIYNERPLAHYYKNGERVSDSKEVMQEFGSNYSGDRLLWYLAETVLLSRCDSVLSGITSATEAAILLNDGRYSHIEMLDTGVY